MSYLLRRLPLSRLLLLCGLVVLLGISATALASALSAGPTPPAKPLAQAIHDALAGASGESVQGVSANIVLTDHLLEGASLASGGEGSSAAGQLASSPLLTGGSGRMWIAKDGRVRLELQAEKGDTQVLYDGHTVSVYDASSNTLYRYTIPAQKGDTATDPTTTSPEHHEVPTVAKIEEAISHLDHVNVSGATPADIAGRAAYTVRVSPKESGSEIGGGELSFDAANGIPLRAAIYSSNSPSSPALELAASEISYGPVADSVFSVTPPPDAKIEEVKPPEGAAKSTGPSAAQSGDHPLLSTSGHGPATVAVIESKTKESTAKSPSAMTEGLQKVKIGSIEASELPTALGTLLSFERSGVRYVLGGFVAPSAVETVAKGL